MDQRPNSYRRVSQVTDMWFDESGEYVTAPDLSVTITKDEAIRAFCVFDHCDWDAIESKVAPGSVDTSGTLIDRTNRNLRLMVMAESVTIARGAEIGTGTRLMDNQYFESMINAMLDSFEEVAARR